MTRIFKKGFFAILFIAMIVLSSLATPSFAVANDMEIISIQTLSEDGEVLNTFSSQEEFEQSFLPEVSPCYESCGNGLYSHGQFVTIEKTPCRIFYDNGAGYACIVDAIYVVETCNSCGAVYQSYYIFP